MRIDSSEARVEKRQRAIPHLDPEAAGLSLAMVTQEIPAVKRPELGDTAK